MIKNSVLLLVLSTLLLQSVKAQSPTESTQLDKEFSNLEEALQNPENVFRLNLSDQNFQISDSIWSKFPNLQYLSLKNDHLKQIPSGIGNLKNLKVLDLSGNDFKILPLTFSNLTNLQELYLNDNKYFQLQKNIPILSGLPNLKSLHLENDGLKVLPKNIFKLNQLESLYLNNNQFKEFPKEINGLTNLKYLDLRENIIRFPNQKIDNQNFGIKIEF